MAKTKAKAKLAGKSVKASKTGKPGAAKAVARTKTKAKAAGGAALRKLDAALRMLETVKTPPIPVEHLVSEGHALARVANKYEKELRRVGVDAKLIASIETRATALAEAQSELALARGRKRTASEIEVEQRGIALRSEMVADGRFALRDDEDAQASLNRIQEGEGLDDLVQDLRDLSAFAKKYEKALAKIGVKVDRKVKDAQKLAASLEEQVVGRRVGDVDEHSAVELRDRAATYLLEAVREIRAAGAYVFRTAPEIAARFRGAYDAQRRAHRTPKDKSKANGATSANGGANTTAS
ncbi:hypothetical protein AKJ09_03534 [Labilithrix luteola]|uniref:Uncharacterized protein n=1 Tax=Labilithrix luteola TaxID=1391654 RepID=A0A0K1PTL2_9BACT|nr:hypothetical protein [Labilithrix luteola]AKU96870.1 hypothetical protein AKJ09_03534 [Labilithrix luteola]